MFTCITMYTTLRFGFCVFVLTRTHKTANTNVPLCCFVRVAVWMLKFACILRQCAPRVSVNACRVVMGAAMFGGGGPTAGAHDAKTTAVATDAVRPAPPVAWLVRAIRTRAMDTGIATSAAHTATAVSEDLLTVLRSLVRKVVAAADCGAAPSTGAASGSVITANPVLRADARAGTDLATKLSRWGLRDFFRMDRALQQTLLPAIAVNRLVCAAVFAGSTSAEFDLDVMGDGGTLVHHFAECATCPGFDALTWILARDEGAQLDLDKSDSLGRTPLMRAALTANVRAVRTLLLARADTGKRDKRRKTAVFYAVDGMSHGPRWAECYVAIGNASSPEARTMPRALGFALSAQTYAATVLKQTVSNVDLGPVPALAPA